MIKKCELKDCNNFTSGVLKILDKETLKEIDVCCVCWGLYQIEREDKVK